MKNRFLLLAVYFCALTYCTAQVNEVEAVIDFSKEQEGHVTISGKAVSSTNLPQSYSYSMDLTKTADGNNAVSKQSGKFTTQKKEEKVLSSVQMNLSDLTQFEVVLRIYRNEKMVAERILKNDSSFFEAYKKLAIIPQTQKPTKKINPTLNRKESQENQIKKQASDIEIGGLIIDDTRSKIGRDFYDVFYGKWTDPEDGSDFSITIRELPARGRASMVAIEVDGNIVVQRMVQPRQDVIALLAEQSVGLVKNYLLKKKDLNKELESQDQSGSGIF